MTSDSDMLPVDSDVEVEDQRPHARPPHLRPFLIVLVAIGGAFGTAVRELISGAVPEFADFPIAVFGINIVGAFILGAVLEALARRGPDEGLRQRLRLFVGTGFCGGFTTYSSLAATSAVLIATGQAWKALAYGAATVLLGIFASWAGIAAASAARSDSDQ